MNATKKTKTQKAKEALYAHWGKGLVTLVVTFVTAYGDDIRGLVGKKPEPNKYELVFRGEDGKNIMAEIEKINTKLDNHIKDNETTRLGDVKFNETNFEYIKKLIDLKR